MNNIETLDEKYWNEINDKTALAGITLDSSISPEDIDAYGNRLADRQVLMFQKAQSVDLEDANLLDVGCGLGRIMKPFSKYFKEVVGVDINSKILEAAKFYLDIDSSPNMKLVSNDGRNLPFEESTFDYVYSGGVLQHIPDIEVVMNYFVEGLRVLKPGGILNFSVQTWMNSRQGGVDGDRVGAKILATDIDTILNSTGHELHAIFSDPKDPRPHFNILIRKAAPEVAQENIATRLNKPIKIEPQIVENLAVRTGIFEDLESYSNHRNVWKQPQRAITCFE